jgi:predicted nucleic acid-binding protein
MPTDIVIDTNVLLHADNPQEKRQHDCIKLIHLLLESSEVLCFDEGLDFVESKNRSRIWREYSLNIRNTMLGYKMIETLLRNKRFKLVPTAVTRSAGKEIKRISDKEDRVFVKVAINSDDQILLSHDYSAFPVKKRSQLKGKLGITIVAACDYLS